MNAPVLMRPFLFTAAICLAVNSATAELPEDALAATKKATAFLVDQVSIEGGYLWSYSADLTLREGEGVVTGDTIWVQPPGTPSVGEAFVKLYHATGDRQFLDAALKAADSLRRGQMRSGGWQAMVEFEPDRRKRWAYRVNDVSSKAKDQSSLDDDKTQSALRFLIQLDQALEFKDESIHEMTLFGLDGLLTRGQFTGGGFPQVWTDRRPDEADTPARRAGYPKTWEREYPGHNEYWYRYTLNDHLARDVMMVLLLADEVYGEPRYRESAIKLADSLLDAQMPDPQPAWAQQYNAQMEPIWARKFEPPAITTSESFSVIDTLMMAYRETGDHKYLEPIPRALEYLSSCALPDGRVARFYELKTNRPLYFTREYKLTYDDSDMPTHYGFQLDSKVEKLRKQYDRITRMSADQLAAADRGNGTPGRGTVEELIDRMDDRGAWLSDGGLKYNKAEGPTIQMGEAVKNLTILAAYLAGVKR